MKKTLEAVKQNTVFVLVFLGLIAAIFAITFLIERMIQKKNGTNEKVFTTRKMASIGIFSAVATVLMIFDMPVFFAPAFYKLDLSELMALIGAFAFGPAAGVMIEFIKILVKVLIKGSSTAFVGELANFIVGCSMIIPASVIYELKKNKKTAIWACVAGTLCMAVVGSLFNAVYLLPTFAKMYGMPIEKLVAMGKKVNPLVKDGSVTSLVLACVVPLNLVKGLIVSVVTIFVYKPLSPIIKGNMPAKRKNTEN